MQSNAWPAQSQTHCHNLYTIKVKLYNVKERILEKIAVKWDTYDPRPVFNNLFNPDEHFTRMKSLEPQRMYQKIWETYLPKK